MVTATAAAAAPIITATPRLGNGNGTEPKEMPPIAYDLTETRFGIGRNALNRAIDGLNPKDARLIERFWRYCAERNMPRSQVGTILRKPSGEFYSADSVYQFLTGRRNEQGANLGPMLKAIVDFLAQVEPTTKTEGFIETRLAHEMWAYIDRAKLRQRISFMFGDMSIGKSVNAGEYARRNPDTIYTRMPTRGHLGPYLKECARKLALGAYSGIASLQDRVIDGLPACLIVDEADQCFQGIKNHLGLSTLDYIREAYDRKPLTVVFIMDYHGRNELMRGANAMRLKRLFRRRLAPLHLPATVYKEDADLFAQSFGLDPAPDELVPVKTNVADEGGKTREIKLSENPRRLQDLVLAKDGLAKWISILEDAADLAKDQRKPISWGAVIKAHAMDAAMEAAAS